MYSDPSIVRQLASINNSQSNSQTNLLANPNDLTNTNNTSNNTQINQNESNNTTNDKNENKNNHKDKNEKNNTNETENQNTETHDSLITTNEEMSKNIHLNRPRLNERIIFWPNYKLVLGIDFLRHWNQVQHIAQLSGALHVRAAEVTNKKAKQKKMQHSYNHTHFWVFFALFFQNTNLKTIFIR